MAKTTEGMIAATKAAGVEVTKSEHAKCAGEGSKGAHSPRPAVRTLLAVVLTVSGVGLAACGGDNGETDGDEPILVSTRLTAPTGAVVGGSSIGDSPFCLGGTFRDEHGDETTWLVHRAFRCPEGSLRIGFTPGVPQGGTQRGPWGILSGTGAFEGLQGNGQMEATYVRGSRTRGRETFTGTVNR